MNVILEATPIVSDGPAWFAAVGVVSTMVVSLFKEYMPIIGKKIDVEKYVKEISRLNEKVEQQRLDIVTLTQELSTKNSVISRLEGWFFAMKQHLEEMGATDIMDLINKKRDESNS